MTPDASHRSATSLPEYGYPRKTLRGGVFPISVSRTESRDHTGMLEAGKTQNGGQVVPYNRNNAASDSAA